LCAVKYLLNRLAQFIRVNKIRDAKNFPLFLLFRISIDSYDLGCPPKLCSLSNLTQ